MKTGRKKKLNSFVQFPEELDMSAYVGAPSGSHVYALKGVLMHVGADANHGHYIAHIQVRARIAGKVSCARILLVDLLTSFPGRVELARLARPKR